MNGHGESYGSTVPRKPSNKGNGAPSPAEKVEGKDPIKGKSEARNSDRTQRREELQNKWTRIWQKAKGNKGEKFTALWHHVYDVNRLREAYFGLKHNSAAGVDGETWEEYGEKLEENLVDLSERLKRGAYRAKPVKRVFIPKADGKLRPIGIPTLEDKIAQRSTTEILNAIYEADFKGFSYGFRPKRNQHRALDALSVAIQHRKVNWILDADIRGFFDTIDHEWLMKFIEHRITDKRVVRHIKKWLNAGVLQEGKLIQVEEGTPQGGSVSPCLANVYLHYVFDLWANAWRRQKARGEVAIVRFADDIVVGFQHEREAKQFLEEMRERFRKFNLELHSEKTRLIEFGRFAARDRERQGKGKPETFTFLGFTHICGKTRKSGSFIILRQTARKKVKAKLSQLYQKMKEQRHDPIPKMGSWLRPVLRGHYQYYGVPMNSAATTNFCHELTRLWLGVLRRRSQKHKLTWKRMNRFVARWLPGPKIYHPYPWDRLRIRPAIRT
jgi:RNA-directed DNA polymerase